LLTLGKSYFSVKKIGISEATVRTRLNRLISEEFIQIVAVSQTTGGTGIDTEFVVKSLDELNDLIFEKINKIDGVVKTETSLFLKYIKRQYDWGTAIG
jgi:Lrp/AsnC family transcriptional regulator for asnA, asnC and gidA